MLRMGLNQTLKCMKETDEEEKIKLNENKIITGIGILELKKQ